MHLLSRLLGDTKVERLIEEELKFPGVMRNNNVSREEILEGLGVGLEALIRSRNGGLVWVEQTPRHVHMIRPLIDMYPNSRFVHLLRDGRDVVNSMMSFEHAQDATIRKAAKTAGLYPQWATDFSVACQTWADSVEAAMRAETRWPTRVRTFRYGSLIDEPEELFKRVLDFIGQPRTREPANYVRSTRVGSSFGDTERVTPGAAFLEWTTGQQELFTMVCGDTMQRWVASDWQDTLP